MHGSSSNNIASCQVVRLCLKGPFLGGGDHLAISIAKTYDHGHHFFMFNTTRSINMSSSISSLATIHGN